jgi:hypothetical protein
MNAFTTHGCGYTKIFGRRQAYSRDAPEYLPSPMTELYAWESSFRNDITKKEGYICRVVRGAHTATSRTPLKQSSNEASRQESPMAEPDYEAIRSCASDLRIALTRDLLSRSRPPTGKKWMQKTRDLTNGF